MQKIKNNEFGYLGNPSVKRDGVETQFTKQEVIEYARCMKDPSYFAKTYLKVISLDSGLVPFKLYPYQEKMFDHFNKNRFSIIQLLYFINNLCRYLLILIRFLNRCI